MARCKECFHLEACIHLLETAYPKYKGKNIEFNATCEMFKSKADFVEVVRCKDCKHGDVSIIQRTKDGKETWGCYCNVKNKVTDVDAYCSCGKKRGNENGNQQ